MTESCNPTPVRSNGGTSPASNSTTPCPANNYKITSIDVTVDATNNIVVMNDPEEKITATAVVTYTQDDAGIPFSELVTKVEFTFSDPGSNNTAKNDSFEYETATSKFLGKKSDAAAIHWEIHENHSATSDNAFKTNAKADLTVVTANVSAEAKVYLKPSGVGGDDFKITGKAFKPDGTTLEATDESDAFTVWRKVTFNAYEMNGVTSITTHATAASMANYYTNDTFVKYEMGSITAIPQNKSVDYIGLWDHATSAELTWSTHSRKIPSETPTADETTKANGAAGADQNTARAAIRAKANAWRDRINAAFNSGLGSWATDAGIPVNSIVGIKEIHPKYSAAADVSGGDARTAEWSAFSGWLQIIVHGNTIHPDACWLPGEGVSVGNRAYITSGLSSARTKLAIAHEVGHETKNQFKRKPFGSGDHSSASGLMDTVGSLSSFTTAEKEVLRGFD